MCMFCDQCGAKLAEGASFCTECGTPVPQRSVPVAPVCEHCGAKLVEGASFCTECGTPVVAGDHSLTADATPATGATTVLPSFEQVSSGAPAGAAPISPTGRHRQRRTVILTAVACGVVVCLLAVWAILANVVFTPARSASEYLRALASGSYSKATTLVPSGLPKRQRALLSTAAASSSRDRISSPRVLSVTDAGNGMRAASVQYRLAGKTVHTTLNLRRSGVPGVSRWRVTDPLLNTIRIVAPAKSPRAVVNGVTIRLSSAAFRTTSPTVPSGVSAAERKAFRASTYTEYWVHSYPQRVRVTTPSGSHLTSAISATAPGEHPAYLLDLRASSTSSDVSSKDATQLGGQLDRAIASANGTSATASAAVMRLGDEEGTSYGSAAANTKFAAAGLYLPIFLDAQSTGMGLDEATSMMQTMDNDTANGLLDELGGTGALNSWLQGYGYSGTSYSRNFGDADASASGMDNFSTASDAARMLASVDADGATDLMNFDLTGDGVAVPSGMTVHAHRGTGIQDSYNVFAVVQAHGHLAGVAIMTQGLQQPDAVQVVSSVLQTVSSQLRK